MNNIREGLSLSEIIIPPRNTEIVPEQVSLRTRITKGENGIYLNLPVMSAAMDTITEHKMAILMAQFGGLGVIHRAMPIERQVAEVSEVKSETWFMILNPETLSPYDKLRTAKDLMEKKGISGIPVVEGGKVVGIITARDVRFASEDKLRKPIGRIKQRALVTIHKSYARDEERIKQFFDECAIEKLPVVDENMQLVGLITSKDFEKRKQHPNAVLDKNGRLLAGAAIGASDKEIERAEELIKAGADLLVLDSAHGNSKPVQDAVRKIKRKWPEVPLMAGNVATAETTLALIGAGADAIKVGVGCGSICTTRDVTGIGRPQATAVMDCVGNGGRSVPIVVDGGLRKAGHIMAALVLGADAVMSGSFFAATDEAPGNIMIIEKEKRKIYRGMGSAALMNEADFDRYHGGVPEGVEKPEPYKGPAGPIIAELAGGIKKGLADINCASMEDLRLLTAKRKIWEVSSLATMMSEGFQDKK